MITAPGRVRGGHADQQTRDRHAAIVSAQTAARSQPGRRDGVPDEVPARPYSTAVRATGAQVHDHYQTGRWLPHCSIAPRARLERMPLVAAAVYDVLPLPVRVVRAALIDSTTGQARPLPNLP